MNTILTFDYLAFDFPTIWPRFNLIVPQVPVLVFEELGINQLPLVTKRRKHNLAELQINEHGEIDFEEDDDEDFSIF